MEPNHTSAKERGILILLPWQQPTALRLSVKVKVTIPGNFVLGFFLRISALHVVLSCSVIIWVSGAPIGNSREL